MKMKPLIGSLLLIVFGPCAVAQYYYKDFIVTGQASARWKQFSTSRVRSVSLSSSESDGIPTEGFAIDQDVSADFSLVTTHTRSKGSTESWLFAYYSPAGLPVRTVDTSDTYRSVSEYRYDPSGRLESITNTSIETDNHTQALEEHFWQYGADGKPSGMLKILNGTDTTFVRLVQDEKGNITEEHAVRNRSELPVVYYYYDGDNRLTDIVRYNQRAKRLLPDYIFEYDEGLRLSSMLIVPEQGVSQYQKWVYQYNEKGLKVKESCFNKQKEFVGSIGYAYTYR
jgi:YD repeat-containing protein